VLEEIQVPCVVHFLFHSVLRIVRLDTCKDFVSNTPILFLTSDPDCFQRFVNGFAKNNYFQVPFTNLHKETNEALWPYLRVSYSILRNDHFVGSYGLLSKTRAGGRPEIILEHAEDEAGPWKEYQFLYKPGNISTAPVFIGTNLIAIQR
jgi:hypothetical protein